MNRPLTVSLVSSLVLLSVITSAQAPWTQQFPQGAQPPVRQFGASTVLDAQNDRLIMFGGNTGGPTNTVWVLSNATGTGPKVWTQLFPSGTAPAGVANHAAVYDPGMNRMIVFGGCNGGCSPLNNNVYVLSNANGLGGTPAWTQLFPSGPVPAKRHSVGAAYDQATNQLIVFGGHDGSGAVNGATTFDDTWLLRNANGLGGPPQWVMVDVWPTPDGRYAPSAAFDALNNSLVITGGVTAAGVNTNSTWMLTGVTSGSGTWLNSIPPDTPGSPVPFANIKGAYHPGQGRLFLPIPNPATGTHDLWMLQNATSWTRLTPSSGPPSTFSAIGSVYNQGNNVLLSFMAGPGVNQLWSIEPDVNAPPAFIAPTPINGSSFELRAGQQFLQNLAASDANTGNTVTIDFVSLPAGVLTGTNGPANPVNRSLDWRPSISQTGLHSFSFTASDNQGASATTTFTVNVTPNAPPLFEPPTPFAPIVVAAGTPLSFMVQARDPDAGDGFTIDVDLSTLPAGAFSAGNGFGNPASRSFNWTPGTMHVGTHVIRFSATDLAGARTEQTVTITVPANNAPVFAAPTPFAPLSVTAGTPIDITLVAVDPDPANTVQINVNFGTLPSGIFVGPSTGSNPARLNLSWTPSSNNVGTHTIQVTAQDNLFATTPHSITITVLPPQLTAVSVNPVAATIHNGGQSFNATARYSDGSSKFLTSAPGLLWSSSNPAVASIGSGGFAQAMTPGQTTITASLDGVSCAATNECATLTVRNGTPVAAINGGPSFVRNEGTLSLFLNSQSTDPDFDQLTHQWSIVSGPGAFSGGTNGFGASFVNSDGPGLTTIELRVTDNYGASATTTATIETKNVSPTVSIFGNNPINIVEGSSISNVGGSFQDPGTDTWTATANYGDGSSAQPLTLTNKNFQLSHPYAQYGVYTVTVTVTDDDGGVGTQTKTVNVSNVMPLIQAGSGSDTVLAGQPFTRTGSFSDPGISAWTGTVNYGDGSGAQPLALTAKTFALNHVYSAGGTYPVSIAISDGVSTATATISVTVVSVPSFSQLPDTPPGECVCTPVTQIVTPNSPQDWFVKADASGSLTVTLVGIVSNEFAQQLQSRILDLDGTIRAQMSTSYPANSEEETQFRASQTITTTPGALYRVQVASPTAQRARYFLRFDGTVVAGMSSPTFSNIYGGSSTWLLNTDGGDSLSVRLFTQGIAEFQGPMPRLLVYQWVAPNGVAEPVQSVAVTVPQAPQFLDTTLQPPSAVTPGIWRLRVSNDFDYRLEKQSGADRGLYLDHRSGGRGSLKVHLVDQNGAPFTDPVNMRISISPLKFMDLTVENGVFDLPIADGFVYHFDVTPPAGRIVSPASFDMTVVCDQLAETTVVIAPPLPPTLAVALSQAELWPANSQMMAIDAAIDAASPYGNAIEIALVSVVDSESGAGDVSGTAFGTDDRSFEVRAEKSGGNADRTYTVTYRATDTGTGLSTTATATVVVPHSQGKDKKPQD